jgi:enoyl-CoA hydratase
MDIRVERQGRVQVISLDRAEARNAVHPAMAQALFDAFRVFEADDAVDVAVLTGAGGVFCAGFDLKSAARGDGAEWIDRLDIPEDWDPVADPRPGPMGPTRLRLSKPVIAAVEGPAVAGGMELALWCDMRVVSVTGYFGVYCRRWGVPLIDGGTVRLPRIVGQGRANDLILTGRKVPAGEAQAMGLADRVVAAGGALDAALDLALELTKLPQGCLRADHASARMPPEQMAEALRREWRSAEMVRGEGVAGAARFAAGAGRGGAPAV